MTGSDGGLVRGAAARAQSSDPLMRVRAELLGPDVPLLRGMEVPVGLLREVGWTAEVYRRLAGLARHALAIGAWAADPDNDALNHLLRDRGQAGQVTEGRLLAAAMQDLFRLGEFAIWAGASVTEVECWLTVYASATGEHESVRLRAGLGGWGRDFPLSLGAWSVMPGEVAGFAYAAGLTPEEAERRAAVGTLKDADLRVLGGLRGWVFPPLP